jgi:hypothetical protein
MLSVDVGTGLFTCARRFNVMGGIEINIVYKYTELTVDASRRSLYQPKTDANQY